MPMGSNGPVSSSTASMHSKRSDIRPEQKFLHLGSSSGLSAAEEARWAEAGGGLTPIPLAKNAWKLSDQGAMPLHGNTWQHWYRKYWADSTTPSVIFEGLRAGSGSCTLGDQLFSLCSVKTLERPSTVRTAAEEESKPWHMRRWQQGNATSHLPEQKLI